MSNRVKSQWIILRDMDRGGRAAAFLGENVRRLRKQHRYSQQRLAKEAGLSRSTIAAIEDNRYNSADTATVVAIAAVFKLDPGALLVPQPQRGPSAEFVEEFMASPWATALRPGEAELEWLTSLPDVVYFGSRPTPESIAKILIWRRESEQKAP